MTDWLVRHEGSPTSTPVPTARRVMEGLRDGDWEPTDEVRGPGDGDFVAIEDHPLFADAVAEMAPPPSRPPDETHLDMNPLIDVALVLLIFFILTTSYSSLRRAIDLPPAPDETKPAPAVKMDDIKDTVFNVTVWMEKDKPVIEIEKRGGVSLGELEFQLTETVNKTGRREMFADVRGDVPWGVEARLYDAAKAAGVNKIWWPRASK
jgi:biopolymer transport protein ExbD